LRTGSIDLALLNNVMEHLDQPEKLLQSVARALKPSGRIAIAVPFIIKVHQAPFDFFRYTHYALQNMLERTGFGSISIEAVYTPQSLFGVFLRETFHAVPGLHFWHRPIAAICGGIAWIAFRIANRVIRPPSFVTKDVDAAQAVISNPWITGYQVQAAKR
jgi:SAM-dependent methyltransferase